MRAISTAPWQLLTEYRSQDGTASIAAHYQGSERPHVFATILAEALVPLAAQLGTGLAGAPILISGMASSSIGWQELPYANLPLELDGSGLVCSRMPSVASALGEHPVLLISGVRSAIDIMRGEETELIGVFALPGISDLAADAVVVKPGTHCKHLRVRNKRLVDFRTHMTGELFAVLCGHSVLKHSVGQDSSGSPSLSMEDFLAGIELGKSQPTGAALFRVRTRDVLDQVPAADNRAFLSGVLIGAELAELARESSDTPIILAATEPSAQSYHQALLHLGLESRLTVVAPDDVELLSARGQSRLLSRLPSEA
jgi:2-dehydro-3-deoxygalactonokinase